MFVGMMGSESSKRCSYNYNVYRLWKDVNTDFRKDHDTVSEAELLPRSPV